MERGRIRSFFSLISSFSLSLSRSSEARGGWDDYISESQRTSVMKLPIISEPPDHSLLFLLIIFTQKAVADSSFPQASMVRSPAYRVRGLVWMSQHMLRAGIFNLE
ncbi:hypothetical protein B0H11DRAFT_1955079 [Mycena galericulata]|nr:hypothetical protein B0H11DRAFT_1955079 [Mycena galericulata]